MRIFVGFFVLCGALVRFGVAVGAFVTFGFFVRTGRFVVFGFFVRAGYVADGVGVAETVDVSSSACGTTDRPA